MIDEDIERVIGDFKILEKISDIVRFVDPVNKRVINTKNYNTEILNMHCFDFWGKNKACDNCISVLAFYKNETYVKIEYNNDKTYMITAIPFELSGRRVVIELLKDTTNSLFLGTTGESNINITEVHALIDTMNSLASKDQLTGIYNRRYIEQKLPVDLINSVLLKQDMSIIMADIDFFKKVNDTYGHIIGDYTLKSFAETLQSCIKRGSDWVSRYGGEEFLICLPGANLEKAKFIAELMRKSVEDKELSFGDISLKITASFGVYCVNSRTDDSLDKLIQYVDEKLYIAKNNGRNRIEY